MRAAVAVLGDRKKVTAFVRSVKNELTDAELSLVRKWRSHPWFYRAFTVIDDPASSLSDLSALNQKNCGSPQFLPCKLPKEPSLSGFLGLKGYLRP